MFGSTSPERAAGPLEATLSHIPARTLNRATGAEIIGGHIEQREGTDPLPLNNISSGAGFGHDARDDARIAVAGPRTMRPPLSMGGRDHGIDPSDNRPRLATPPPTRGPAHVSFLRGSTPPSPTISLPHTPQPDAKDHLSISSLYLSESGMGTKPIGYKQSPDLDPRWTVGGDGFAEPNESPTEAFKVVSQEQPPGWMSARIRSIGYGMCFF
jgi:hypothetical protein